MAELLEDQGVVRDFGDDESLITSGLLDSLAVIEIVVLLEKEFDMDFSSLSFDQNDFDSLEAITGFVEKHPQARRRR